jgi:hypothetical protein
MTQENSSRLRWLILSLAMIASSATVWADAWNEQGDAGSLRGSAQVPTGSGPLASIDGMISGLNDVDVYKIYVAGGKRFSASTHASSGGAASFDNMLFLFDSEGYGVYYDDDIDQTYLAHLPANDPLTPMTPGDLLFGRCGLWKRCRQCSGTDFPP